MGPDADRITASALLLLITGRPERCRYCPVHRLLTQLSLGRLGRAAVAAMVASRVSDHQMTVSSEAILSAPMVSRCSSRNCKGG